MTAATSTLVIVSTGIRADCARYPSRGRRRIFVIALTAAARTRLPPIWISEAIGIVVPVPISIERPNWVAVRRDRINGEEPSDGGIVIALNKATRRDPAPPTVRRLDAVPLRTGQRPRHACSSSQKMP